MDYRTIKTSNKMLRKASIKKSDFKHTEIKQEDVLKMLKIWKTYDLSKREFITLDELMKEIPKTDIEIKYLD